MNPGNIGRREIMLVASHLEKTVVDASEQPGYISVLVVLDSLGKAIDRCATQILLQYSTCQPARANESRGC